MNWTIRMGCPSNFHFYFLFLEKPRIVKKILLFLVSIAFFACASQEEVDVIVHNANTYTVDDNLPKATSVAIRDGRFLEVGEDAPILKKYNAKQVLDAKGKTMVPGLIDAHAHLVGLGQALMQADLVGARSTAEIVNASTSSTKSIVATVRDRISGSVTNGVATSDASAHP